MSDEYTVYLTPDALDAWLAGHEPTQSVGTRLTLRRCPLACYLSAQTGFVFRVWGDECEPSEGPEADQLIWLPRWLRLFTVHCDGSPTETITARDARSYLMRAVAEDAALNSPEKGAQPL